MVSYNLLNATDLSKGPFKFKPALDEYKESSVHVQDAPLASGSGISDYMERS
jgi:hypothetical protein